MKLNPLREGVASKRAWPLIDPYPTNHGLAVDFAGVKLMGRKFYKRGNDRAAAVTDIAGASFTSGTGFTESAGGVLVPWAANQPRIDEGGVSIDGITANLLFNGQGTGSVGAAPPGWGMGQAYGGVNPSAWSSGTDDKGYGYTQFRVNGTPTIANRLLITPTVTWLPVTAGSTYSIAYNTHLVAGAYAGVVRSNFIWRDAGGATVGASYAGIANPPTSTSTRWANESAVAPAGATQVQIYFDFFVVVAIGQLADFTVRLGGVMFKAGLWGPYVPTTAGAVSRPADRLLVPSPSPAGYPYTVYAEVEFGAVAPINYARLVADGASAITQISLMNGGPRVQTWNGVTPLNGPAGGAPLVGRILKAAACFRSTGRTITSDGLPAVSDAVLHPMPATFQIGGSIDPTTYLGGKVRRVIVECVDTSAAQLQAMTA